MIHRFNIAIVSLWLALAPAGAQMAPWQPMALQPAPSGGSPTFTGQTSGNNTSCGFATTCAVTLTATGGLLVVGIGGQNVSGTTANVSAVATSGTCGTVSLTSAVSPTVPANNSFIALYYGTVSSGSCTITATSSAAGGFFQVGMAIGTLNNLSSSTPGTSCSNNFNNAGGSGIYACLSSITVASGGFGIAVFSDISGPDTLSSSNITIDTTNPAASALTVTIGHSSAAGSLTPQFTTSGGAFGVTSLAASPWS